MAFIKPMHRNKPNITYLLHSCFFTRKKVYCIIVICAVFTEMCLYEFIASALLGTLLFETETVAYVYL